jgi:uncharacterized membrane protein YkvA (DUF1232 family)
MKRTRFTAAHTVKKRGWFGKLVLIIAAITYVFFPIDVIPDFVPLLGIADDIVAAIISLKALISK